MITIEKIYIYINQFYTGQEEPKIWVKIKSMIFVLVQKRSDFQAYENMVIDPSTPKRKKKKKEKLIIIVKIGPNNNSPNKQIGTNW